MSPRTRRKIELWLPVLLWALFIAFWSHIPYLKSPYKMDYLYRKVAHVVEYFVLAMLMGRAFRETGEGRGWVWKAFLSAVLFACSDELHQNFVPGRWGTFKDLGFDTLGSALGLGAYVLRQSLWPTPIRDYGPEARAALPSQSGDR